MAEGVTSVHGDGARNDESTSTAGHQEEHISFDPAGSASALPQYLCSMSAWYPHFSECTFRTEIIPVSQSIADWLVQDGIMLPDVDGAFPTRVRDEFDSSDEYSSDGDSNEASERSESASSGASTPSTPSCSPEELGTLFASIAASIERLGGAVVPKMQWSCPKDACWMLPNNTLRCTNANEVCLLLKSSDRIAHDVETMGQLLALEREGVDEASTESDRHGDSPRSTIGAHGEQNAASVGKQHVIALRTYYNLKPGREFRCFVKNGRLCAISQRGQEYHRHLVDDRDAFRDQIVGFFEASIRPKLFLNDVVFDCYVPEGSPKVRLIDFNVFGADSCTHPYLFSWDEIVGPELDGTDVAIRVVSDETTSGTIRPSETSLYGVPYDFVHEGATEQLKDFLERAAIS